MMGGSPVVQVVEHVRDLHAPVGHGQLVDATAGRVPEAREEVAARDVLHDEVEARRAFVEEVVVDGRDRGVFERGEEHRLALEVVDGLLVLPLVEVRLHHLLDGARRVAEVAVFGEVDGAHAAAADLADDLVTRVEHGAGIELRGALAAVAAARARGAAGARRLVAGVAPPLGLVGGGAARGPRVVERRHDAVNRHLDWQRLDDVRGVVGGRRVGGRRAFGRGRDVRLVRLVERAGLRAGVDNCGGGFVRGGVVRARGFVPGVRVLLGAVDEGRLELRVDAAAAGVARRRRDRRVESFRVFVAERLGGRGGHVARAAGVTFAGGGGARGAGLRRSGGRGRLRHAAVAAEAVFRRDRRVACWTGRHHNCWPFALRAGGNLEAGAEGRPTRPRPLLLDDVKAQERFADDDFIAVT